MTPESWLIVTVATGFLLVGIAASPMAWVVMHHRRLRFEELMEERWRELSAQVSVLEGLMTRPDADSKPGTGNGAAVTDHAARTPRGAATTPTRGVHPASTTMDGPMETALIAVPALAEAPNHRESSVSGLEERFAAIWNLADSGGSAEAIARATGQPIGQIDLILGLRRQIDGARTTTPHAPAG